MGASLEELVEAGGLGRADSSWNVGIGHTVLLMFTDSDRKAPTSTGPARRERKKKWHLPALSSPGTRTPGTSSSALKLDNKSPSHKIQSCLN